MLNTVVKDFVTPAELLILRNIHGEDAVVKLRIHAMNKRPHAKELARLRDAYDRPIEEVFLVNSLFPGASAHVPVTFKEIGVKEDDSAEEEVVDEPEAEEVIELKPAKAKAKKQPLAEVLDMSDFDPILDA